MAAENASFDAGSIEDLWFVALLLDLAGPAEGDLVRALRGEH